MTFAMAFGGSVGGNAVEALLFTRFGTQYLPQLYIVLGLLNVLAAVAGSAIIARGNRGRFYVRLPLAMAIVLVIARLLLAAGLPWFYPVLWLVMCAIGTVQALVAWGLAGLVCDTRQAKRLFPLLAAGSVLAAVLGGIATPILVTLLHAENLLFVWSLCLVITFGAGRVLLRRIQRELPPDPNATFVRNIRQGVGVVARSRMLTWLLVAAVLFSALYFSLTFPFARAAARQYPGPDQLSGYLGTFQAVSTGTAFAVAILFANRFFARYGLMTGVLLFPLIYLAGFLSLAVHPDFSIIVAFRFVQMAWLFGVASSAFHAIFNVIPTELRDQGRAVVDGIGTPLGTIIGGLLLLVGLQFFSDRDLYILGSAQAAFALIACWMARRQYRLALHDALRSGQPDVFIAEEKPFSGFAQDAAAMRVATQGLTDADPRIRRISAEVISQAGEGSARGRLLGLLSDPDPHVRISVLRGIGPEWRRALELLDDPDAAVRCTAAAVLINNGAREPARSTLETAARSEDEDVRCVALAYLSADRVDLLDAGLADGSPRVRRAAAAGLARAAPGHAWDEILVGRNESVLLEELRDIPGDRRAAARAYAVGKVTTARRLLALAGSSAGAGDSDVHRLLTESLRSEAEKAAILAFEALRVLSHTAGLEAAIRGLASGEGELRANALEMLEAEEPALVRPLLAIWELAPSRRPVDGWLAEILDGDDEWLKACAQLVVGASSGSMKTLATLSLMDKVLFLRKVALFDEVSPADLKQVAVLANERVYPKAAEMVRQGDPGDELYIIVGGKVLVMMNSRQVAVRSPGDCVGEMAILTREPRSATLIAESEVRVLCIERRDFQAMLGDRPEIGLAVIRTLAQRLRETTSQLGPSPPQ
jgi:CRP/FNR family cyclic AMP-dependent transcriptional regulator